MKTITIPVNYDKQGTRRITHTLRREGSFDRHGLGCVLRGEEGRQYHGGPMEAGPWAYAYGLCVVIDNNGGSGKESADGLSAGSEHFFNYGDCLVIDEITYEIKKSPNNNIRLVKVE